MAIAYNTFGNEIKYTITQDVLQTYVENATIKFPLPEASSDILSNLAPTTGIDPMMLEVITGKLVKLGFQQVKAKVMASVLIAVAQDQGLDPQLYFTDSEQALKLANDTYDVINAMRPVGNQIGVSTPIKNSKSRYSKLIQP